MKVRALHDHTWDPRRQKIAEQKLTLREELSPPNEALPLVTLLCHLCITMHDVDSETALLLGKQPMVKADSHGDE